MNQPIVTLCARKGHGKDTVAGILVERYGFQQIAFADPIKWLAERMFGIDPNTQWGPSELREKPLRAVLKEVYLLDMNDAYWLQVYRNVDKNAEWINHLFYDEKRKVQVCPDAIPSLLVFVRNFQKLAEGKDRYTSGDLTVRHILQQLGTEWGRSLWSNLWCYHAFRSIEGVKLGMTYKRTEGLVQSTGGKPPRGFAISDCRFPDNETRYTVDNGGCLWWIDSSKRIREVFDPRAREHSSEPDKQAFLDAGFLPTDIDNNGTIDDLKRVVKTALKTMKV